MLFLQILYFVLISLTFSPTIVLVRPVPLPTDGQCGGGAGASGPRQRPPSRPQWDVLTEMEVRASRCPAAAAVRLPPLPAVTRRLQTDDSTHATAAAQVSTGFTQCSTANYHFTVSSFCRMNSDTL